MQGQIAILEGEAFHPNHFGHFSSLVIKKIATPKTIIKNNSGKKSFGFAPLSLEEKKNERRISKNNQTNNAE